MPRKSEIQPVAKAGPLAAVAARQCVTVAAIEAWDADLHSLMAMGICQGRRLNLLRTGDPLIVCVCGTRIGLSARLAEHILVETGPVADATSTPETP